MDKKSNSTETTDASGTSGDQQTKLILFLILGIALAAPLLSMVVTIKAVNEKIEALKPTPVPSAENASGEANAKANAPVMSFYQPLEFLVNLADVAENHYLRTTVSLALAVEGGAAASEGGHGGHGGAKESPAVQKLKNQEPIIRDTIIAVISSKQFKELTTVAGKEALKENIRNRLQEQLGLSNLSIYFTAFTLQ